MTPSPAGHTPAPGGGAANGGPVMGIGRQQWADAWAGLKAIAPLMAGSAAFGLAFGALIPAAGINGWTGLFASVSVVAGASQISIVESIRSNAPAFIAVLTALIINARFALYSAALGPVFAAFPRRWKLGLAHLMTDQAAVTALHYADRYPDPVRRRWFVLGGALPFILVWVVGTVVGILAGPIIPSSWNIGFIVPLMFIAVMVPALKRPEELVGLGVTAAVVLLSKGLPFGLNVLTGIIAGIAAGTVFAEAADARRAARGQHVETVVEAAEREAGEGI
ncbi:MAG: branched-chain amino acid ABC transporter permease [Demequinaceae bacterium]|nr:branched-chain amino acid ABC transporter permease [Demequinaceae bacterium]